MPHLLEKIPFGELIPGDRFIKALGNSTKRARYTKTDNGQYRRDGRNNHRGLSATTEVYFLSHDPLFLSYEEFNKQLAEKKS